MIISRWILLKTRNISEKSCRENQNTRFTFSNFFFFLFFFFFFFVLENRVVNEVMWKNIVEPDRFQMTIWRMRIARWIPKAKNTQSQYVFLIAFPPQQWLHELAWMLRYTYIACPVLVFLLSSSKCWDSSQDSNSNFYLMHLMQPSRFKFSIINPLALIKKIIRIFFTLWAGQWMWVCRYYDIPCCDTV